MAERVTARMAAFIPGASPPAVKIPMLLICLLYTSRGFDISGLYGKTWWGEMGFEDPDVYKRQALVPLLQDL